MEKIVIYVNDLQVEKETEICENGLPVLQEILNEFEKIQCKLNASKFFDFIATATSVGKTDERTENLLKLIIVENLDEIPKIMGLTISKDKLKDMVEIPNLSEFLKLINNTEREIMIMQPFVTIDNYTANISKDFAEKIKLRYTVFADNEKQIEAFKILTSLKNAMNKYSETLKIAPYGIVEGLEIAHGQYRIDGKYIKQRF